MAVRALNSLAVALLAAASPACGNSRSSAQTVTVAIDPRTAALATGTSLTFTASVTGSSDTTITWSVQEGAAGGTVTAGTYTAPGSAGTYHVVATSTADPTRSATAATRARGGC